MIYSTTVSKDKFYPKYLRTVNGALKLSDKEILVLAEFMKHNEKYIKDPEIVFSSPIRKKVQIALNMSPANLNNYIQYLKNKNVIIDEEDMIVINKMVIPKIVNNESSVTFNFKINE